MSDRLQINAVARPRPTPAPKMQAPAAPGTIQLKDKGKYVLFNGEVVTMTKRPHTFADGSPVFMSSDHWNYRQDGRWCGEELNPTFKRHVAKEWDGKVIMTHDEACGFWLGGGTVFYRQKGMPWMVFPAPTPTINAKFFDGYRNVFEWSKQA